MSYQLAQKRCSLKMSYCFTLPAISDSVFFFPPPRSFTVKLVWFPSFPCLLLVYTVVLVWNRILGFFSFWAGSWSRQTQSRLTSSPRRFPRQFAVCVNTLFLPSSPPLPARWRPAVGLLCVDTHGDTEKSINWHHQSAAYRDAFTYASLRQTLP